MKKRISFFIVFLLISVYCFSETDKVLYCKAIDNHINIRTEPNTNCKVLGQLFEDDVIKIYENKSLEKWYYCYIPKISDYGYCFKEYFKEYKPWFFEVVDKLIDKDSFYIEMVETNNTQQWFSAEIFTEKLEQCSEDEILEFIKFAYKYNCIRDSNSRGNLITECVQRNYILITKYLLENTNEIEVINNIYESYYGPVLLSSILRGYIEITELLLQYGADPNGKARNGQKMFYWIEDQIKKGEYSEEIGKKLKNILLKYGYIE